MPGELTEDLSSLTYNNIKAFIYDIRARKEWAETAD